MPPRILQGKKALVTGGSRGIGRATVLALAEAGADVAINYRQCVAGGGRGLPRCPRAWGAGPHLSGRYLPAKKKPSEWSMPCLSDFGAIDILVNNAGITRDKTFLKMSRSLWDEVLGVNLTGTVQRHAGRAARNGGGGLGTRDQHGLDRRPDRQLRPDQLRGDQGGLIAFTMTLAREVSRKGVTVNAVAPGFIETDMTKDMPEASLATVKAMTPVGRLGRPEEVAAVIRFLASPQASYITGQVIPVNGGMYM